MDCEMRLEEAHPIWRITATAPIIPSNKAANAIATVFNMDPDEPACGGGTVVMGGLTAGLAEGVAGAATVAAGAGAMGSGTTAGLACGTTVWAGAAVFAATGVGAG